VNGDRSHGSTVGDVTRHRGSSPRALARLFSMLRVSWCGLGAECGAFVCRPHTPISTDSRAETAREKETPKGLSPDLSSPLAGPPLRPWCRRKRYATFADILRTA